MCGVRRATPTSVDHRSWEVVVNHPVLSGLLVLGALAATPLAARACGEGMFNTGKGLRYQAYLAPRPAAVLVYTVPDASGEERDALYAGLEKAGHTVTVVHDADALKRAIAEHRYDVVISAFDAVDAIPAQADTETAAPTVLPVVARSERNSPQLRSRFDLFVLDGASLGQYLRAINKAVAVRAR
jgi:CheY-like chemotaxis protein